jgi:hypothetical protein
MLCDRSLQVRAALDARAGATELLATVSSSCCYIEVSKMVRRVLTLGYPCCLLSLDYSCPWTTKKKPMDKSSGSKVTGEDTWLHEKLKDEKSMLQLEVYRREERAGDDRWEGEER